MSDFDVSNPENRLDVQADRSQFSLVGYHLCSSIQAEEVFRCTLKPGHAEQLKALLDTWLFRESGGKVGHMIWELGRFVQDLSERKENPAGAERIAEIICEAIDRAGEENIPPQEIALELSSLLANFLSFWMVSLKNTASMQ